MTEVSPIILDADTVQSSYKENLRLIESRVVDLSTAAANAESDEQYLEFRRQYIVEAGRQLDELVCYSKSEPMEALRYLLSRVRRLVAEIDDSEFIEAQDKILVQNIQQKYDQLVLILAKCLSTSVVSAVFEMFDLGHKEFTLRYYIAVMRCYDEKCKQGLFGANRVKKRIQEINERYGLADHVSMVQVSAKVKDYKQEIFPFLESMLRAENLYDNGAVLQKSVAVLDAELRCIQTKLVILRDQMFEIGFYVDEADKSDLSC
ncbi:hypothetical protein MNBD_GAMMA12-379 [hydrothermal vent metagenome]|uniref:Uncharacterized protein n=1 Tax=hydrothermal vent metagenome TaxID=652676 RepID=A0A3B0YUT3_9ZZZZ